MLSMWKLRVGAEDYYLEQVAKGLDDYYSGAGETQGEWIGTASAALGLEHDVIGDELRAVLAGLAPGTGLTPNNTQVVTFKNRVPGFDLTFSAPKTVSVLYALGDPLVRAQVVAATDLAVAEALGWLEREACFVRRGSNNKAAKTTEFEQWGTRRMPAAGFIAAQFRHRTSRLGDPQLHSHVLIANMTKGPDGKWSALDGQALYRSRIAAGTVYQSVLRNELTRRLGVEWTEVDKGLADIIGIPDRVRRLFSKRRTEIEIELDRTGQSGPAAAAAASLETRTTKTDIDQETLDAQWIAEAASVDYGPEHINRFLANTRDISTEHAQRHADGVLSSESMIAVQSHSKFHDTIVHEELTIDDFAARIGHILPETDAVVNRLGVQNAVAAQLGASGSIRLLERLTDAVLAHAELVPLAPGAAAYVAFEQRWTTRTLLNKEAELTALFTPGHAVGVGSTAVLDPALVAAYLAANTTLGPDQADTLRRLTSQGLGVEAVVGKAGTGKTYAMNAVRELYESAGYRVLGACPTGRAARELSDGAGIDAGTIQRFNVHDLNDRTVVVMDEAGMIGTFNFHHVITHARRAGAKVIVVGDHHQLPEIEAGGSFASLLNAVGDRRCELTINRRQRHEWEHAALDHLRAGEIAEFWQAYLDHGRVVLADNRAEVQGRAVGDWFAAYQSGSNAHMLAGTIAEAKLLNDVARSFVARTGRLTGDVYEIKGREFQRGDRVLLTKNMGHQLDVDTGVEVRVDNGMLGDIIAINPERETIDVQLVSGRNIRLDSYYVTGEYLTHGYATTFHKAQGLTCDDVFVVGPAGMYRESGYVALSRARNEARLYATTGEAAALGERSHATGIPLPTEHVSSDANDIVAMLSVSMAKQFASAHQPHLAVIADIAHQFSLGDLESRQAHINRVAAQLRKDGHTDPTRAIERHTAAVEHRSLMHVGGRVNALDRDNIGTVTHLIDTVGHATVEFTSSDGEHTYTKTMAWENLRPVDSPQPAEITPLAARYLDELDQILTGELHEWEHALATHNVDVSDFEMIPAAITQRRLQLVHQLRATPPPWLRYWIGDRPTDPTGAVVYDDHLTKLAQWRDTHHLDDTTPGYGPAPVNPEHRTQWEHHLDDALNTRRWLNNHNPSLQRETHDPIDLGDARNRLIELDALFADAPPDMRRIIEDIQTNNTLDPADRIEALAAANKHQTERSDWILEYWPNVVEYLEVGAITADAGPLDHWPTPLRAAAQTLYNQLAANTVDTPQASSLLELDQRLLEISPAHQANIARLYGTNSAPKSKPSALKPTPLVPQSVTNTSHASSNDATTPPNKSSTTTDSDDSTAGTPNPTPNSPTPSTNAPTTSPTTPSPPTPTGSPTSSTTPPPPIPTSPSTNSNNSSPASPPTANAPTSPAPTRSARHRSRKLRAALSRVRAIRCETLASPLRPA